MSRNRAPVLPAPGDKARVVEEMFDRIAPRYDVLNRVLTLRMDVGWRRAAVDALGLERGGRVLDLACGTGDLCVALEQRGMYAVGVDFSERMLEHAHVRGRVVRGDAAMLPFADATFDGLTCGFALRNFTALEDVLRECARVVRPKGRVALLEVAEPGGALAHAAHRLWFRRVVPLVGALLSDRAAYRYLPASVSYLPAAERLLDMLTNAHFLELSRRTLGFGAAQLITGTRA